MTALLKLFQTLLLFASIVDANPFPHKPKPLPPSQDPFYKPPPFYESTAPGTVLGIRQAPQDLSPIFNVSEVYNVLYRTTDSHYQPSWALTTLLVPRSHGNGKQKHAPTRMLSYQVAYDSPDVDASPSFALLDIYNSTFPDISLALNQGWFVNIPDYEGPLASFTAGVQSGHATLDSIRAILNSNLLKEDKKDVRTVIWGYSGGALASEWATELQVQYAPELEIRGAALGGLPADILATMHAVNKGLYAGLIPLGVLGEASQYPDLHDYLVAHLKPTGPFNKTYFMNTIHQNYLQGLASFAFQDILQYFDNGEAFFQSKPFLNMYYRDGLMGYHGVPQIPIFSYKAIGDEVAPAPASDIVMERFCAVGGNLLYQRNTVGGHADENINGRQRAWEWLSGAIDNTSFQSGCVIQNVTISISNTGQ
ncbi:secretory lipase-domain-containing protein [Xylogone sp. PMI_703]|nr:secretory lipase-domain-containing protein [Xylogone sp. PMI_703]